jgi:FKBP-type peptidyl-prolyl cis-trans isomerase
VKKTTSAAAILVLAATCMACDQRPRSQDSAATAAAAAAGDEKTDDFKTLEDRFSYAYGVDLAEKFKAEGIDLNVALLMDGMQSVLGGGERRMSADEVAATMEVFQEVHLKEKEAERAVAAEKNKKEGEAFLAANAKKEGVVVTKSRLQYKVITPGDGGYKPTLDDEVTVHYRGTFIDGTEFDSTYKRNKAYSANPKQLIQGWTEAMLLMSKGAKWELYVPADLAYGEQGSDPYIGPNAVLIFEVELLEIERGMHPGRASK